MAFPICTNREPSDSSCLLDSSTRPAGLRPHGQSRRQEHSALAALYRSTALNHGLRCQESSHRGSQRGGQEDPSEL